jgi:hypothetical protein
MRLMSLLQLLPLKRARFVGINFTKSLKIWALFFWKNFVQDIKVRF